MIKAKNKLCTQCSWVTPITFPPTWGDAREVGTQPSLLPHLGISGWRGKSRGLGSAIYKLCDLEQIFNLSDLPVVLFKNRNSNSPDHRELVWGLNGIKGRTGYRAGARYTLVPLTWVASPCSQAQFRHCFLPEVFPESQIWAGSLFLWAYPTTGLHLLTLVFTSKPSRCTHPSVSNRG